MDISNEVNQLWVDYVEANTKRWFSVLKEDHLFDFSQKPKYKESDVAISTIASFAFSLLFLIAYINTSLAIGYEPQLLIGLPASLPFVHTLYTGYHYYYETGAIKADRYRVWNNAYFQRFCHTGHFLLTDLLTEHPDLTVEHIQNVIETEYEAAKEKVHRAEERLLKARRQLKSTNIESIEHELKELSEKKEKALKQLQLAKQELASAGIKDF